MVVSARSNRRVSGLPPETWLALACGVVIALALVQVLAFSFGRDQSIYAQVASTILDGGMPYRDAWDFKPPGVFLIYAAAQALLGKAMWSVRVLEVLGLLSLLVAFRRFSAHYFGSALVGLVGGAIAILLHAELEFWHTGQPESFGAMATALALAIVAREPETSRGRFQQWAAVGALFGFAFLLKPPLGGGALVCGLYLARREWFRTASRVRALMSLFVIGGASLGVLGAALAWFAWRGAWPELAWTLFEFTPGYTKLGWDREPVLNGLYYATMELLWKFSALPIVGAFFALRLRSLHEREREGLLLVGGVIAIQLVGVVMQGKYFQYHYGATLPLISLVAGVGFFKLWQRVVAQGRDATLGFAAFLLVVTSLRVAVRDLPGTFWERSADRLTTLATFPGPLARAELDARLYRVADYDLAANREVAQSIVDLTPPEARIFVWGFEPSIYWLSGRRPASRFIYDVAQRVSWEREHARRQLMMELSDPPRVIVVQHGDVFSFVTGDSLDSDAAIATFPEFATLLESRYDKLRSIQDFDLYVLRGPG